MYRNKLSSGRWDATGSWDEAVASEQDKADKWAGELDYVCLARVLDAMAEDTNAYTLYQRKAILKLAAEWIREGG